jgi:RES domain-containing protein
MTAYRIAKTKYAATIWSGNGAREYGGRWNSRGIAVAYAAENRSLAAMEQLVHLIQPRLLKDYVISSITFDDTQVFRSNPNDLPAGWDKPVPPSSLRQIGDVWAIDARFAVLAVPSAITPSEWNFLINPAHPEFAAMLKSPPELFAFDDRLG